MADRTLEENIKKAVAVFDDIETAIEDKGIPVPSGTDTSLYAGMIRQIGEPEKQDKTLDVTENGSYTLLPDANKSLSSATVNVDVPLKYDEGYSEGYTEGYGKGYDKGYPEGYEASQNSITLQEKTTTENGEITADEGYTGLSKVTVDVPERKEEQSKALDVTENGSYDIIPDEGKVLSSASVNVNVPSKEEQEKTLTVTENGSYEVLPDENKALSKVNVEVDVSDDFIGIKYLNYSGADYNLPTVADARSLDKILIHPDILTEQNKNVFAAENGHCLDYAFTNPSQNANGGYFVQLEDAYLPTKAISLTFTFQSCIKLKHVYGELTNMKNLNSAFDNCRELEELPYMPNLVSVGNNSFRNCNKLREVSLPSSVTTCHSGAFANATGLENVILAEGWNLTINVSWSTNLTQESLHKMIENLADLTGQSAKVFQVGNTNVEKIDEEHIAILESKNWEYY